MTVIRRPHIGRRPHPGADPRRGRPSGARHAHSNGRASSSAGSRRDPAPAINRGDAPRDAGHGAAAREVLRQRPRRCGSICGRAYDFMARPSAKWRTRSPRIPTRPRRRVLLDVGCQIAAARAELPVKRLPLLRRRGIGLLTNTGVSTGLWGRSSRRLARGSSNTRSARNGAGSTRAASPAHHLGQQAAADRAQRQAEMLVAEVEPQALVARRRADDRQHVGQAGPPAEPGLRRRAARRAETFRARTARADRDGPDDGGSSRAGEFRAGRQPQAARHRRDDIALLEVEHRAARARRCRAARSACGSRA